MKSCPECNKLSRLWEELAKEVNSSEMQNVGIGKANCDTESELCEGSRNNKQIMIYVIVISGICTWLIHLKDHCNQLKKNLKKVR